MKPHSYKSFPKLNIEGEDVILEEIYIAPLGHLMIKFYKESNKTWNTYNVGKWKEVILPLIEEKINGEVTPYLKDFEIINKTV
jgi:hypothetical protein